MDWSTTRHIFLKGIWHQNAGLVQILGMCPVLAISTNLINAISLGLATTLVMLFSGATVASIRNVVPQELRNPIFILIIATVVTVIDLCIHAYLEALYKVLGIFIPLIVTNCIVLARAEAWASKNNVIQSGLDGLAMGLGLTLVLAILGALREVIGQGTLFSGIDLVWGPGAKSWVVYILPATYHYQFLLATLPCGAFFGVGLLIAIRNRYHLQNKATLELPIRSDAQAPYSAAK